MFSRLRLGTQLCIMLSLLLAASSIGLTWYFIQVRTKALSAAAQQRISKQEESLAGKVALLARNGALGAKEAALVMDFEFLQGVVSATAKNDPTIVFGYIADAQHNVVVHSDRSVVGKTIAGAGNVADQKIGLVKIEVGGQSVLEAVAPIILDDAVWGAVHYAVSLASLQREAENTKAELESVIRDGVLSSTRWALVIFVLSVVLTIVVARRLVRPVRRIEDAIQRILAGRLETRVEVPAVRELGRVATGFNALVGQLNERERQLRDELRRAEGEGDASSASEVASAPDNAPVRGRSLSSQLVMLMLGFTVASILVLGGSLFYSLRGELTQSAAKLHAQIRADLADKGFAITRNAALAAGQAAEGKDFLFLVQLVRSTLLDDAEIVSGFVEDTRGQVLVHDNPQKAGTVNTVPEHALAIKEKRAESRLVDREGTPMLEVTAPIDVGGVPWGTITFGLSHARMEEILADIRRSQAERVKQAFMATGAGAVALLIVGALLAWLAARRLARPLHRLTQDLDKIGAGDLEVRVRVRSCREFGTFAMGINELTAAAADRDQQLKEHIRQMKKRAEREALCASLVKDGRTPTYATFDAVALLDEVRDSLAGRARKRNVRLEMPPVGKEVLVESDKWMVAQILYELVDNAIKFSEESGTVVVDLQQGDVDGRRVVRFHVRDTGVGMAKKDVESVFARASKGTSDKGVGLPIARRLTELLSGTLSAASAGERRGSTFVVELSMTRPG